MLHFPQEISNMVKGDDPLITGSKEVTWSEASTRTVWEIPHSEFLVPIILRAAWKSNNTVRAEPATSKKGPMGATARTAQGGGLNRRAQRV